MLEQGRGEGLGPVSWICRSEKPSPVTCHVFAGGHPSPTLVSLSPASGARTKSLRIGSSSLAGPTSPRGQGGAPKGSLEWSLWASASPAILLPSGRFCGQEVLSVHRGHLEPVCAPGLAGRTSCCAGREERAHRAALPGSPRASPCQQWTRCVFLDGGGGASLCGCPCMMCGLLCFDRREPN